MDSGTQDFPLIDCCCLQAYGGRPAQGGGHSNGRGVVVFSKDKRPVIPRKRKKQEEEAEEAAPKVVKPRGAASIAPHHKPGELARPTERASVPQARATWRRFDANSEMAR